MHSAEHLTGTISHVAEMIITPVYRCVSGTLSMPVSGKPAAQATAIRTHFITVYPLWFHPRLYVLSPWPFPGARQASPYTSGS